MGVVELLVVLGLLVAVAFVAGGRGDAMSDEPPLSAPGLDPQAPPTAADLQRLRLPVVLRGYRMADVDAVLDRTADRLGELEAELERLRRAQPRPAAEAFPTARPAERETG